MSPQIPHYAETERQALAAIIRNGALFDVATGAGITGNSFYSPDNQRIFVAMEALARQGIPIDLPTLGEKLPDLIVELGKLECGAIATDVNFPAWLARLRSCEAAG